MNKIYLRRKNKIYIEGGQESSDSNNSILATALMNMETIGYTLDKELIETMITMDETDLYRECLSMQDTLLNMVGDYDYKPMYPNFPAQVAEAHEAELYINALIHYLSDGTYLPDYKKENRSALKDFKDLKTITAGTKEEFQSIFKNLLSSKVAMSDTDKQDLQWYFETHKNKSVEILPNEFPAKENMAFTACLLMNYTDEGTRIKGYTKTATDVLRIATAMSGGDVSLSENTKFTKIPRKNRRLLLNLLEGCGNIEQDMVRHRNKWIKLGEALHPSEYAKKYPKTNAAFYKLRNRVKITTFNGELDVALKSGDTEKTISLLKTRPGEYARRLDYILRTTNSHETIINGFSEVADKVSTSVLLQTMAHFNNRKQNETNKIRSFIPKGRIANIAVVENTLPPISQESCFSIVDICRNSLKREFSQQPNLGKVYIDEELKNIPIPMSKRSDNDALRLLPRGSKEKISEETDTIRGFIHWKNCEGENNEGRVDIDLSAIMYDKNWNYCSHISYTNLKGYDAYHSGDITDAPDGASEFIDINMKSLQENDIRYVAFNINSFTGQKFKDIPELLVGWMAREYPQSGEVYEPKTVANRINMVNNSVINLPIIVDITERKVIHTDIDIKGSSRYNRVEGSKKNIAKIGQAITNNSKPSLYELFRLHAEARGTLCDNIKEADTVFAINQGITPFDTEIITSEYLGSSANLKEERASKLNKLNQVNTHKTPLL